MKKQRIYWSIIGLCLVISLAFFLRTKQQIEFLQGLHHQEVEQVKWMNQAVRALSKGDLNSFYPALSQVTSDSIRQNLITMFRQSLVRQEVGAYGDPMSQDWRELYQIQEKLLKEKEWRLQYYGRQIDSLTKYSSNYAMESAAARAYREALQEELAKLSRQEQELKKALVEMHENEPMSIEFINRKGLKVSYFGQVKNGKAHGYGVGFYEGGGVYRGYWSENARHGQGLYTWKNGDTYEGNYVEGERTGFGIYTFASGEKYRGDWKSDVRDGYGELWSADGQLQWKGQWQKDKYVR